ncbi:hypothetical protein ACFQGT_09615 [Natrialbaceae archaeon GCM10025810]|uniref:hypothetical protein n=1 Tax=Halovalidus salilacus TaxID=3075124 RepID=UPI003608F151
MTIQRDSIPGQRGLPFRIRGNGVYFAPTYVPDRIQIAKERNLVRHANFCGLEDVFEVHAKNREVHVTGTILHSELGSFERVLDHNDVADLSTPGWSGKIRVVQGDYEGPVGWDPRSGDYLWGYTLDLVSTGEDEAEHLRFAGNGIVHDGRGRGTVGGIMQSIASDMDDAVSSHLNSS